MPDSGMTKLMEECGELTAAIAKKSSTRQGVVLSNIDAKVEDEMGDVLAAMWFVQEKLGLSDHDIMARAQAKYNLFKHWDTVE